MLDNLSFAFQPNDDEEEYASAYDLYLGNVAGRYEKELGLVFVCDELNSRKIAELFVTSPRLLGSVRAFVDWALGQPPKARPNLDPIVADARALLNKLDN